MVDKKISISVDNDSLIIKEVKNEFLKYHPEMKGLRLSRNFLIGKMIEHYTKKIL